MYTHPYLCHSAFSLLELFLYKWLVVLMQVVFEDLDISLGWSVEIVELMLSKALQSIRRFLLVALNRLLTPFSLWFPCQGGLEVRTLTQR